MERTSDETDLLIIGGGPAGMSAAIHAKQIANQLGKVGYSIQAMKIMLTYFRLYLFLNLS